MSATLVLCFSFSCVLVQVIVAPGHSSALDANSKMIGYFLGRFDRTVSTCASVAAYSTLYIIALIIMVHYAIDSLFSPLVYKLACRSLFFSFVFFVVMFFVALKSSAAWSIGTEFRIPSSSITLVLCDSSISLTGFSFGGVSLLCDSVTIGSVVEVVSGCWSSQIYCLAVNPSSVFLASPLCSSLYRPCIDFTCAFPSCLIVVTHHRSLALDMCEDIVSVASVGKAIGLSSVVGAGCAVKKRLKGVNFFPRCTWASCKNFNSCTIKTNSLWCAGTFFIVLQLPSCWSVQLSCSSSGGIPDLLGVLELKRRTDSRRTYIWTVFNCQSTHG